MSEVLVAPDPFVEEAKRRLLEKLEAHPDAGVRAMAVFGLPDDAPQVQSIATALRAIAARTS